MLHIAAEMCERSVEAACSGAAVDSQGNLGIEVRLRTGSTHGENNVRL